MDNHKNVNFVLLDREGFSEDLAGVIGIFLRPNAYAVLPGKDQHGNLFFQGQRVKVNRHQKGRHKDCWNISKVDAKTLLTEFATIQ